MIGPLLLMHIGHQITLGDLQLALTVIAVTDHPLAEFAHHRPTLLTPTHPYLEVTDNEAAHQGIVQEVPRGEADMMGLATGQGRDHLLPEASPLPGIRTPDHLLEHAAILGLHLHALGHLYH
ncbi:MAG: hypothetical protein Q9210_002936 [Variospora velana]